MEIHYARCLRLPHMCLLILLLPLLYCLLSILPILYRGSWSSTPPENMNSLSSCVNPDLPKNEFTQSLIHLPTTELHQHRLALFHEACDKSLVLSDYINLPLVGKKDTAIKPASHKLSDDIWTIVSCIRNEVPIPRTLFRNGKRSKTFLSQISQISQASQASQEESNQNSSSSSSFVNPPRPLVSSSSESNDSETNINHTSAPTCLNPPSSSCISSFFISREFNELKDEIRSMKADIAAAFHSKQPTDTSPATNISHEVMAIKKELTSLCEAVSSLSSHRHVNPCFDTASHSQLTMSSNASPSHVKITTWNCRGYRNAIPYLSSLLEDNTDVIALSEHWLWPFELADLNNLHPDYTSIGCADKRLDEHSSLNRGCGGVGLIW